MSRYPNGKVPDSVLIHIGGDHYVTAGTNAKWEAMRADVYANEGVWLYITPGPNAYRNLGWQQHYWDTLPYPQAAYPSTSSHGGEHDGDDAMALDIGNWAAIGREKFTHYCNKHGFEPNYFSWEPWHIIDWEPWRTVPAPTPNPTPTPTPEEEEDEEMALKGAHYTNKAGTSVYILFNEVSGFYVEHSGVDGGTYNNPIARDWGTGSWPVITEGHAVVIKRSLDAVRRTTVTGSLSVDLSE